MRVCVCIRARVRICVFGSSSGVVSNVLDCEIVVSAFELQSVNDVNFQTLILGKDMNSRISPAAFGLRGLHLH